MRYELYYWPSIQGRGEFVRLALEEAGADYLDVAREPARKGGGEAAILRLLDGAALARPPFAPPVLRAGRLVIAQTANILMYLGARHGLAPANEAGKLWAHQIQLTIADLVQEIHDTHHPISGNLYYEDQRREARARAADFLKSRAPKYLGYFERVLARNPAGNKHLIGARLAYPDLSLFQAVAGLRYAFPNAMARIERKIPFTVALHDAVARRPRIAAYLASERRIPFGEDGIFRHYRELDEKS
ncbi:MAG: glutathione S-transferase [Rhodospirillales bacterium]|nr:glutathione S-transferase [Rhodospirillales bacterium]